jgi:hypothetical protein
MVLGMIDNAIEDSNRIINSLTNYSIDLHLQMETCTIKALLAHALSKVQVPDHITIIDQTTDEFEVSLDAGKTQ